MNEDRGSTNENMTLKNGRKIAKDEANNNFTWEKPKFKDCKEEDKGI